MLFTTPLTLNDGAANHIFNWLYQIPGAVSGIYTETAAPSSEEAQIRTAHTTANGGSVKRHLVSLTQRNALVDPDADEPTDALVTVNITVTHHAKHADASVDGVLAMSGDIIAALTSAALKRSEI